MNEHRIAAIAFSKALASEDSPLTCTCGWEGLVNQFNDHRMAEGLKKGDRMLAGAAKYENTPWRTRGAMAIKRMGYSR